MNPAPKRRIDGWWCRHKISDCDCDTYVMVAALLLAAKYAPVPAKKRKAK